MIGPAGFCAGPRKDAATEDVGEWVVEMDFGYCARRRPWVICRRHTGWRGGIETLSTAFLLPRRFGSKEAAEKVAERLNRATPNDLDNRPEGGKPPKGPR